MDLIKVVRDSVEGMGYELVDINLPQRNGLFSVYIDNSEGISLDDCEKVSNHLAKLLQVEGFDYGRLEVSSPGTDRRLNRIIDFEKRIGSSINVKLREPIDGSFKARGSIKAVDEESLTLETKSGDIVVPIKQVELARLAPEFNLGGE